MSIDELISSIQDKIEKTTIVLEESQEILAEVQHDLNRLVAAGAGVVINHRKRVRALQKLLPTIEPPRCLLLKLLLIHQQRLVKF